MSDVSMATTCFDGRIDEPHLNVLRSMRKSVNLLRRQMMTDYKAMQHADPDDREEMEPDFDLLRAHYGNDIIVYIATARSKVADGLLNELVLNMVADSVERMKKAWNKTKYFGKFQPNFVFMTKEEITAPISLLNGGSKRTANDQMTTTDIHLGPPTPYRQRTSSPKDAISPAFPMTPRPEVKGEIGKKEAEIARWVEKTGAFNDGVISSPGARNFSGAPGTIVTNDATPLIVLDPPATTPVSEIVRLKMEKEREEMEKQMRAHITQVLDENGKATQRQIQLLQQNFARQLQESCDKAQRAESQMIYVQDQAIKEKERVEKENEMAITAAIETEMRKMREKERNVDQKLREIAEQQKARERQKQADHSAYMQQQQRAEQQIADLKDELKRLTDKVKEAKDMIDRNIVLTTASSGTREDIVNKATTCETPFKDGYLSNEGFFAMKQLAVNKAKDARPEVPFSSGTSIEYALHMNAFDSATDSEALDAKDKLFELTKWFAGPASKIVNAYNVREDKAEAYASVRSELDVFFSQHRDSFSETLKEVKKGGQVDKNDYDTHFELYSNLKEAQMMLVASRQVQEFDRRDVLRDILDSRLEHMSNSFWIKDEEMMRTTGKPMKFNDLLVHVQRWMTVLKNKGMAHKRPSSGTNAISASSVPAKPTYANRLISSRPKQQPTERCNICGSIHATEVCHQLVNNDLESRKSLLLSRGLCFHCFEPDHLAKECPRKKFVCCAYCKKHHATLLHDHSYTSPQRTTADARQFRPSVSSAYATSSSGNDVDVNPTI